MKTRNIFRKTILLLLLSIPVILITSWTKDDKTTNPNTFTAADFTLTIISHVHRPSSSDYRIEYTVKNISTKNYDNNSNDNFILKFTVKDNNGNTFTETDYLLPLIEAGTTKSGTSVIALPSGVIANPSTFTAAVEMY